MKRIKASAPYPQTTRELETRKSKHHALFANFWIERCVWQSCLDVRCAPHSSCSGAQQLATSSNGNHRALERCSALHSQHACRMRSSAHPFPLCTRFRHASAAPRPELRSMIRISRCERAVRTRARSSVHRAVGIPLGRSEGEENEQIPNTSSTDQSTV